MSYELAKQVWELDLTPTEQHVLMAMADYANGDGGSCYPSQPRLAWKTGLSKSTIVRTIDKLVAMNILQIVRPATNKTAAHYQICLEQGTIKAPFEGDNDDSMGSTVTPQSDSRDSVVTPQDDSRDSTTLPQDRLGYHHAISGGSTVTSRGSTVLPDPIINQSYNKSDNESDPFPEKTAEKTTAEKSAETAQTWALCLNELGSQSRTMSDWLQGSELMTTAEKCDGKPLYRLLVVKPDSVQWLKKQAAGRITSRLWSILGYRVALDIVAELEGVTI